MNFVLAIILGTIIGWVVLIVVVPIAEKITREVSMPPWPEMAWKFAVVALTNNAISVLLSPVNSFLAWIVAVIVFWVLMVKWFQVSFLAAVVMCVVSFVLNVALRLLVLGALGQ
jgi:hypothetical protein